MLACWHRLTYLPSLHDLGPLLCLLVGWHEPSQGALHVRAHVRHDMVLLTTACGLDSTYSTVPLTEKKNTNNRGRSTHHG